MIKRRDVNLVSNPLCNFSVDEQLLSSENFKYYDKDGFELNQAEQFYYGKMNFPIDSKILNHKSWQEVWFEVENPSKNLILDHAIILTRCAYSGEALKQLKAISKSIPEAQWLINTVQKWGYDFALDSVSKEGILFEVLHVEYDSKNFDEFLNQLLLVEYTIRHTDWIDAANRIWDHKEQWQNLKSFAQNDWKAKYLLGWNKAEYTEKSLT